MSVESASALELTSFSFDKAVLLGQQHRLFFGIWTGRWTGGLESIADWQAETFTGYTTIHSCIEREGSVRRAAAWRRAIHLEMKLSEMPSSLLMVMFSYWNLVTASSASTVTITTATITTVTTNVTDFQLASTGSGSDYANSCVAASSIYNSASSVWSVAHQSVSTTVYPLGGTSYSYVDYIANATTLCDGQPRVASSPYVTVSSGILTQVNPITGYSTYLATLNSNYNAPSPTCSISPSDCDPLWSTYLSSLSALGPQATSPPLTTPPCLNQSAAASSASFNSMIYGCGKCTVYGEGVQLVYWPVPTTVSRDMCASTPTANLTHYGPSAVITAYAGKSVGDNGASGGSLQGYNAADSGKETIVADGHVFTSGTAYISISTVYAMDRCNRYHGTPVNDAILAMSSQSVLSLRYSQDHFQRLMETDKITGYPVNYADFNTPIPWSAWNGQNQCLGPQANVYCSVIVEDDFRPQLAIPPQITELSPDFQDCQLFYNGLWDPPRALKEQASVALPTLPASYPTQTAPAYSEPASPSSTLAAPTAKATALPDERPSSIAEGSAKPSTYPTGDNTNNPTPSQHEHSASTYPAETPKNQASSPPDSATEDHASSSPDSNTADHSSSSPDSNMNNPSPSSPANEKPTTSKPGKPVMPIAKAPKPSDEPWTTTLVLDEKTYPATGSNKQAMIGTLTLTSGSAAQTLKPGVVMSYGSNGVLIDQRTTADFDTAQTTAMVSEALTATLTIPGSTVTIVQPSRGGVVIVETITLTPGAGPATLDGGEVVSAESEGIAVQEVSTLGVPGSSSAAGESGSGSAQDENSSASSSSSSSGSASSVTPGNGESTTTTTNEDASSTAKAAQTSRAADSGSMEFSIPAMNSFFVVIFMAVVLAV